MDNPTETVAPELTAEPTVNQSDAEIAELKKKNSELQAQKEHWREKYERDITSLQTNEPAPSEEQDVYSDEGKVLKGEIKSLKDTIRSIENKEARREAEAEFPVLKERKADFEAFLEDDENKRLSVRKAATLFLAEQNLLAPEPPERKGLEKPTSGGQAPPEPKITPEQALEIMRTDSRKFEKLIREGKI
mgnify:CR=1 FL=1